MRQRPFLALLAITTLCAVSELAAQPPAASEDGRFDRHLAAGEFSLARGLADRAAAPELRRDRLARLAEAQAGHGAWAASIETASYIDSDRLRSETLSRMRGQRYDGQPGAARGGGIVADFDSLMELIENTVAPESWEAVGGPGTMSPFQAGVHVDATGTLAKLDEAIDALDLEALRERSRSDVQNREVRAASRLRKVSLTRLEREVQMREALGEPPSEAMLRLGGLYKIEYVFVYPETGDIVIAGPAGDWTYDADGRAINVDSGRPLLHLDDLVVCLRNAYDEAGVFGCSIDPRRENLAATQQFLGESKLQGARWREALRETLGMQDIRINGIDPRTRAAQVLLEADYRMKLVGMGLEEGTLGVESYLDLVRLDKDGNPPPMDVVRWWFAMKYDALRVASGGDAFQLQGPSVQVLSESEFLAEDGTREHTGKATGPTAQFARSFTEQFDTMAGKYPVYGELRNVFDLALVCAVIRERGLDERVDWNRTYFGSPTANQQLVYPVTLGPAPLQVATIMNHRTIPGIKDGRRVRHTLVGVSGGVVADTRQFVSAEGLADDDYGLLPAERQTAEPRELDHHDWWWD